MLFNFIKSCIDSNILDADLETGEVFNNGKPFKTISCRGYLVASVRLNRIKKQIKAHQVVWIVSGGKNIKGKILDHKNRNKIDNRLCNLGLVSQIENAKNRRSYSGEFNPAAKINKKIAENIRKSHTHGWSYSAIATNYKISKSLVASIIRRELWA